MPAQGYDTNVVDCQAEALQEFNAQEVFPDMVLIDADHGAYNTLQLIKQLQGHNPTVAIIVLGSPATRPGCITALQAGAADHLRKPVDVDELMARIERHVQRQVMRPGVMRFDGWDRVSFAHGAPVVRTQAGR